MVEVLSDMPPGTVGFRLSGLLDVDDYRNVLVPRLREAVQRGDVRALFVIGADLRPTPKAVWEDLKADIELGLRHWKAWKRIALVSDAGWLRSAAQYLGWLSPGQMRVFGPDELEAAKVWLVADD
jgi:hypothetical protein